MITVIVALIILFFPTKPSVPTEDLGSSQLTTIQPPPEPGPEFLVAGRRLTLQPEGKVRWFNTMCVAHEKWFHSKTLSGTSNVPDTLVAYLYKGAKGILFVSDKKGNINLGHLDVFGLEVKSGVWFLDAANDPIPDWYGKE
ncbi:MAG: hypothetical protein M1320_01440 [Patescibacteria group bacterium]|nr:hypothetical protein [Patescibacteria group bacterium]